MRQYMNLADRQLIAIGQSIGQSEMSEYDDPVLG